MKFNTSYFILATQRSGSTLLCKDMQSTGCMGKPDEHLLGNLEGDEFEINSFFKSCVDENNNFGLKLMSNYLDDASKLLCDNFSLNINENPFHVLINYFKCISDRVVIIFLERDDIFEQALSRVTAKKTNTWHHIDNKVIMRGGEQSSLEAEKARNKVVENIGTPEIIRSINDIIDENEYLKSFLNEINKKDIEICYTSYNDVVYNSNNLLRELAKKKVEITRTMKKISAKKDVLLAKQKFYRDVYSVTNDLFINLLRDSSLELQKQNFKFSYSLMNAAHLLRPNGTFIKEKLKEMNELKSF